MNPRDAQRAFIRSLSERIGRRAARALWEGTWQEKFWPLALGLLIGFAAGSKFGFARGQEQARSEHSPWLKGTVTPQEIEAMESGRSPWPETNGTKQKKPRH